METLLLTVQALHFAACMGLAGALLFRFYAGVGAAATPPPWLWRGGASLALLSGLAWLALEAGAMGNGWSDTVDPGTIGAVLADTDFGAVWRWRLLIGVALVIVAWLRPGTGRDRVGLLLALLSLASLALVGHAIMRPGALGTVQAASQTFHLLAAGVWLGGLPMLAALLLSHAGSPTKLAVARQFSLVGMGGVLVILLTGALNGLLLLGSFSGFATPYGRVLIIKLLLVALMILIASINRLILMPLAANHARSAVALAMIGRTALVEIALGVVVLVVASLLGSLAPPLLG